ncbi:hypothetical protein [Synechococcus sp. 1G10]|uniref:hypothetical protein n=1 Tax=Synechococcus sp. 1G10 TaxID=2025605 RepID=UPI00117EF1C9|nr:hypothetical protein [Synechococcus sp. 1G10]
MPTAVLQVEARRDHLFGLFRMPTHQRLRELLRELPEPDSLLGSFKDPQASDESENTNEFDEAKATATPDNTSPGSSLEVTGDVEQVPDLESWLLRWVDALQFRAGMVRIEAPRSLGTTPTAQEDHAQNTLRLRIGIDLVGGSLQQLLAGLAWSGMLWEWALTDGPRQQRRTLVTSAPPSRLRPKASLLAMARAALRLGVDWHVEDLVSFTPMLVIGRGRGLRRISQKITESTSAWGLHLSKQKMQTTKLLLQAGLPVLGGRLVTTLRQAVDLAEKMGYPVVTKPANLDQGMGVVTGIRSREDLLKAYRRSEAAGTPVLLQPHIRGRDYRFYIVRGRLLAALERISAQVYGDGRSNVRQLVEAANRDRGKNPISVEGEQSIHFNPIKLDHEAKHLLMAQHLSPESVPEDGQVVRLSPIANFSTGGTVRECLAEVHPDNRRLLEKVSRIFHLDIVGIDVISPCLDIPLRISGGVICEVNGMPGVLPHQLAQPNRDLMVETLATLLEDLDRPPLVVLQGGEEARAVIAELERDLSPVFPQLAVVDQDGWRQGGVFWSDDDARSFSGQRRALRDPDTDAFLIELEVESVMKHGLAWVKADVLVLLDGGPSMPLAWDQWLSTCSQVVVATPTRARHLPCQERVVSVTEAANVSSQVMDQLRSLGIIA